MFQSLLTRAFFPSFSTEKGASSYEIPGPIAVLGADTPLPLDSGAQLGPFRIAYQTYGTLNDQKTNAILICHALTGDQFVAGENPITQKPGWWDAMVGPGKPIDTNRFFVICSNILGGCMGSEGPAQINPATGAVWGLDFPVITIHDMARAQKALVDYLGIDKLFLVLGGSMGGMQALSWAVQFPDHLCACAVVATAAKYTAQNIGFHEVGRQAIMSDPLWRQGRYAQEGTRPKAGLSVARMAAHITYVSESALSRKFGRNLQDRSAVSFGFDADFQIESYLRHQGEIFVDRFDPNAYLYVTRAVDYFDLAADYGQGSLAKAFARAKDCRFFVASFSSDWLFPPAENKLLIEAMVSAGCAASYIELQSDRGHDAFLLDEPFFHKQVDIFVRTCEQRFLANPAGGAAPLSAPLSPVSPAMQVVMDCVGEGASVLDIGCGNGDLLAHLAAQKNVRGLGLEMDPAAVQAAMAQGVSVVQGNANKVLGQYLDSVFDVAVMTHTLSELKDPVAILQKLAPMTPRVLVVGTNLAHWSARLYFMFLGRSPMSKMLPHAWYDTPKIRFYTLDDFCVIAGRAGYRVARMIPLRKMGRPLPRFLRPLANLLATQCLYELKRLGDD